jgi:RNase P/RNase MRP subunit POP5
MKWNGLGRGRNVLKVRTVDYEADPTQRELVSCDRNVIGTTRTAMHAIEIPKAKPLILN